jgi:putative GTP pyrophosphokinase
MEPTAPSPELQAYLLEHQDNLVTHIIQFNELMSRYQAAVKEVSTKLEILKSDFQIRNRRSSIESIQSRIKKPVSILKKLNGRGIEVSLETIRSELNDVAGIRVICPFIDDIYMVADKLSVQDDIRVIEVKDYIRNPKPNGYRSYHMIVEVPVFFMDAKESMRVEVQLRTVAMDFWASLEHEIKYKKEIENDEQLIQDLKACADVIAETDRKMLELRERMRRDSQGTFQNTVDEQQEKAPGIPT